MPRPRTPNDKAKVTGRTVTNPGRFNERKSPETAPLGLASDYLDENAKRAWDAFRRECYWLKEGHRAFMEIACTIRGRLMAGQDVGVQALNLLRQCLGQMGATPADESKIAVPDGEAEDPNDRFFN